MSELEGALSREFMGREASAGGVGSSRPAPKSKRAAKTRKFYIVRSQMRSRAAGFRLLNEDALFRNGPSSLSPPKGQRGFRDYPETPVFLADARLGRIDRDFEIYSGYWLITERMKALLEQVDPEAFAFLECSTKLPDGTDGPCRWLCDAMRVLDALDETRSKIRIETADNGSKIYNLFGHTSLVFDENAVGTHRVFRMKYSESIVICDEELKRACKTNSVQGISFKDAVEGSI